VIDNCINANGPRFSEQIRIDLNCDFPDSQFDFEVNDERATNSMVSIITPDDSDVYYHDFDKNIES
jgi:hypothetical protein